MYPLELDTTYQPQSPHGKGVAPSRRKIAVGAYLLDQEDYKVSAVSTGPGKVRVVLRSGSRWLAGLVLGHLLRHRLRPHC